MRTLLIQIRSDPGSSHRPAEALRVAAGIHALGQVQVQVYLGPAASQILSPDRTADLIDGDVIERALGSLRKSNMVFLVADPGPGAPLPQPDASQARFITANHLEALAAKHEIVLQF